MNRMHRMRTDRRWPGLEAYSLALLPSRSGRPAPQMSNVKCQDLTLDAEACEKYGKAVEINPQYARAYYNWGVALGEMGKHAEACEKYAKAVEINPRSARAYFNWGIALALLDKTTEAMEKLDKAAALDPSLKGQVDGLRRKLLRQK